MSRFLRICNGACRQRDRFCHGRAAMLGRSFAIGTLLLILAGCGGDSDRAGEAPLLDASPEASEQTTTSAAAPTTSTPASSTTTTTAEVSAISADTDEVAALWIEAWQAASVGGSSEADVAAFADAETAGILINRADAGGVGRVITNYPAVSPVDENGVFVVNDCLISNPASIGANSNWYRGEVTVTDAGELQMTSLEVEATSGCIPAEIADVAIGDYLTAIAAETAYVETQDSDQLKAGTVEPRTTFITDLVTGLLADGQEIRGRDEIERAPQVSEFKSPTDIVIADCQRPTTSYGVFDIDTGERSEGIPSIEPGTTLAGSIEMVFSDGRWKISGMADRFRVCTPGDPKLRVPTVDVGGERVEDETS